MCRRSSFNINSRQNSDFNLFICSIYCDISMVLSVYFVWVTNNHINYLISRTAQLRVVYVDTNIFRQVHSSVFTIQTLLANKIVIWTWKKKFGLRMYFGYANTWRCLCDVWPSSRGFNTSVSNFKGQISWCWHWYRSNWLSISFIYRTHLRSREDVRDEHSITQIIVTNNN